MMVHNTIIVILFQSKTTNIIALQMNLAQWLEHYTTNFLIMGFNLAYTYIHVPSVIHEEVKQIDQ